MAYKQIDDGAITNDSPLSSVIPRRIDGNNRAAFNQRGKAYSYAYDQQDLPELSFYAPNTDKPARACLPHIWPLSPACTEITIKIRHNVTTETVNLGVSAQRLRSALSGPITPNITTSSATASASDKTTTLTVDVSALTDQESTVDLLLCVTLYSDVDSTQVSLGSNASTTVTGLDSWGHRWGVLGDDPNAGLGTQDAVYPHRVILWTDGETGTGKDASGFYGDPRQVIRIVNDAANSEDIWYIYPAMADVEDANASGSGGTDAWWWYQELGYSQLHGISIRETDFNVYGAADVLTVPLEQGQPVAAEVIRSTLYRPAEDVYLDRTLVLQAGPPTPDLTVTETGAASTALNKVSRLLDVPTSTSTYSEITRMLVGPGPGFTYESVNYARRVYRCKALLSVVFMRGLFWASEGDGGAASDPFTVELRLRMTDTDGTSNAVNGQTTRLDLAPVINPANDADAHRHSMGLLMGFWQRSGTSDGGFSDRTIRRRHTLLGAYPSNVWRQCNWSLAELDIHDENTGSRLLFLQVRAVTPPARIDDLLLQSGSTLFCPCLMLENTHSRNFRALGD